MRLFLNLTYRIIIIVFLSVLTQVGGLIWLVSRLWMWRYRPQFRRAKRFGLFVTIYLLVCLLIVPQLAKLGGRVSLPIVKSGKLVPHTYWTILLNRQYVRADLYQDLLEVADQMEAQYPETKLTYLDANFPFMDGFPLFPHLSHKDGKKVDLAFYYTQNGSSTNRKPAFSGYGAYVEPEVRDTDKTTSCKAAGYWQYDFTKYLTLGTSQDLEFDKARTRALTIALLAQSAGSRILVEPHLRERMGLSAERVRWQGCWAVRHDDHLHFEVR